MSAHGRHLLRTLAIATAFAFVAVVAVTLDASAYVTGHGSGSANATVTTLPAPAITRTSTGGGSVTLTWSAITAPASGTVTYYVTRDGGDPAGSCPTSTRLAAVTSCTDTGLATGSHTYTVTAVWRTWSNTSASASATVTLGAATQLVFTTQPGSGATGGTAFPAQPVVTARDASNAVVTDYNGTVTLTIARGGASGATLSGCTGTLRNGVTTFSGCEIDKAGTGYVLHASDGTLGVDSAAFNVSVGAVAQLAFTVQPSGARGGSAFSTQPDVTAQDAGGNTVTSFSSRVTLSIVSGTGTAGATISNCSNSTARNGVASFDNCEIDKAGTGYVLHASATGGLRGDSAAFDVAVGPVSQLVFTTQPSGAVVRTAFTAQPVVTAQDAGGNTVTSYDRTVTLAIRRFSGASGATLSGCSGTLSGGVTTFTGCQLDKVASDYQLRATADSLTEDSDEFAVVAGAAVRLDFTTNPSSTVTAGNAFSTQPAVTAYDADGNVATGYTGMVVLSKRSGPAAGSLSGCTSSRRNGVTTFSGCKLDKVGSYVLLASDGTLADDSSNVTVNPGTAISLAFTTQPADTTINTAFSTAVTAFDAFGNVATGYSNSLTLTLGSGSGMLSNCNASRSNGVTTFTGCRLNRSGSFTLHASEGGRNPLTADSAAFNVR